jgi:anti-sigma factor RsiW
MQCPLKTAHDCALLLQYCADKLPADEAAAFERHIAVCQECSRAAADQHRVWSALETWEAAPVSVDFDRALYARIEQHYRRSWWHRLRVQMAAGFGWKPAVSVAAACVTVIAAIVISVPDRTPWKPLEESSRIETLELEQVERTLEDLEMLKQLSLPSGSQSL